VVQRTGEQILLLHRLRTSRDRCRRPEENQALDAVAPGFMMTFVWIAEVRLDEFRRVVAVGEDAADFCGGEEHVLGFLGGRTC